MTQTQVDEQRERHRIAYYYTKDNQPIEYNTEIVVWRKHSPQPYIMIRKYVKKIKK